MINQSQLTLLCGSALRATRYLEPLNTAMQGFDINTPVRAAAFLAQVLHESGRLRYVLELASGAAYEGRLDLGNVEPGDGRYFKGRGLIQITGRANYRACSLALYRDERLLDHPSLLEHPEAAARSAAWFWRSRNLNALADSGQFDRITRRINGGLNGAQERRVFHAAAQAALGIRA